MTKTTFISLSRFALGLAAIAIGIYAIVDGVRGLDKPKAVEPTTAATEPSRVGSATPSFKEAIITLTVWPDGMAVEVDAETTVGQKTIGRHWERTVAVSQLVPLDGKGAIDDITINKEIMTDLDKAGAAKATVYVRVMRGFSVDKNDSQRVVGCIDSAEELTKRNVRAYVYKE